MNLFRKVWVVKLACLMSALVSLVGYAENATPTPTAQKRIYQPKTIIVKLRGIKEVGTPQQREANENQFVTEVLKNLKVRLARQRELASGATLYEVYRVEPAQSELPRLLRRPVGMSQAISDCGPDHEKII